MKTEYEEYILKWEPSDMVEIGLEHVDDFLKVKETLTRIGIASNKRLFQSCHILHKQGRYFIVHFKEMFKLDGKISNYTNIDSMRRNTIVQLLSDWGLVRIIDSTKIKEKLPIKMLKIIPHKDKNYWELCSKYDIGKTKVMY